MGAAQSETKTGPPIKCYSSKGSPGIQTCPHGNVCWSARMNLGKAEALVGNQKIKSPTLKGCVPESMAKELCEQLDTMWLMKKGTCNFCKKSLCNK